MRSEAQEIVNQLIAKMRVERCELRLFSINQLVDDIEADPDNDQLWRDAQQYL